MISVKEKALMLAKEKEDSLKNHLAAALSDWMMDNMPGNIIHKIVWQLEGTFVGIAEKTAATMTNPKVRKVGIPITETPITEKDVSKMLKETLSPKKPKKKKKR